MSSPSAYYVCKNEVQEILAAWVAARDLAKAEGRAEPPIPKAVGLVIIQIANNMAKRPNFNGYTYLDEMIGDAICDCTRAVRNYKADHTKQNPFGYFSRVVWNAFLRRIEIEGNEQKTKVDLFLDENYEAYNTIEGDEGHLDKNELRHFYNFGE